MSSNGSKKRKRAGAEYQNEREAFAGGDEDQASSGIGEESVYVERAQLRPQQKLPHAGEPGGGQQKTNSIQNKSTRKQKNRGSEEEEEGEEKLEELIGLAIAPIWSLMYSLKDLLAVGSFVDDPWQTSSMLLRPASFLEDSQSSARKRSSATVKQDTTPKRPLSAYQIFYKEVTFHWVLHDSMYFFVHLWMSLVCIVRVDS